MTKFYNPGKWISTLFMFYLSLCYSSAANYLCFTSKETGITIKYIPSDKNNIPDITYSYDQEKWFPLSSDELILMLGENEKVYLRGKNPNGFSFSSDSFTKFSIDGNVEVSGSVMSLIDNEGESTEIPNEYCFYRLFEGCKIISAPELPATSLKPNCYRQMFWGCPIEKAPELPATKLAKSCYAGMMGMCTNLEETPDLPATELADSCYSGMFTFCSNLKKVVNLPAPTLAKGCYIEMFSFCSQLNYIKVGCPSLDYEEGDNILSATKGWVQSIDGKGYFIFPCGSDYDTHGASAVPDNFDIIRYPITIFQNPDKKELYRDTISCDTAPKYYGEFPPKYKDGLVFKGWDVEPHVHETPDIYYYTAVYGEEEDIDLDKILCFTALESNCTVSYNCMGNKCPDLHFSVDSGKTWKSAEEVIEVELENVGDKVYVRGNNPTGFHNTKDDYFHFKMNGSIAASGSVMSLLDMKGELTEIPCDYCFLNLFTNCPIVQAPELPATVLTKGCYKGMFSTCRSLQKAPELPAEIVKDESYYAMFSNCINLRETPRFNATTLGKYSCQAMFTGCINLTKAYDLTAKKLDNACYANMFTGCGKLEVAPALPATELADSCYSFMFLSCEKMTTAPELPATTLKNSCYANMFTNCKSLEEVPDLKATVVAENCCYGMFISCINLKKAPALPALKLEPTCYNLMFAACINLEEAPELPATNLADECYSGMFTSCPSLNYIKVGLMTLDNEFNATDSWVGGVEGPGVFVFPCGSKYNKHGASEVPNNFKIVSSPIVIFQNPDSTVLYRDTISCDTAPKYYGEFPPKYNGLVFKGWDVEPHVHETPDIYYYTAVYGDEEDIDLDKILCFTAEESNCTISYNCLGNPCPDLQFSVDSGKTWKSMEDVLIVELENVGDKVYVRGNNPTGFHNTKDDYFHFTMKGLISASGSVMSLLDMKGELTEIPCDYCFNNLFINCPLTQAPDLPATVLTKGCYKEMFKRCYFLQKAPELPAETVKDESYETMFNGCSSLSEMPKLPATTLGKRCYYEMFVGCTNLTKAYDLPAKKLETACYAYMFTACSKLEEAPALPATELADSCYCFMFLSCENLTKAPELPATTLKTSCYDHMFTNCQNLETVPDLKATVVAENCCNGMFLGCTYLRKAPALPAKTLERNCYYTMFAACVNLKEAPELPATTLAEGCYNSMFGGCMKLEKAPELPATNLADECYSSMFAGCTSLNYIKVGLMTLDNEFNATDSWVGGVEGPGVFVFPCGSKYNKHGASEVPNNFKIVSSPIVIFQNPDSTVLYSDTINCGDWPSYERCDTCKTPYYGDSLVFINWDKEIEILNEPDIYYYTAVYEKKGEKLNLDKILCFTAEEAGSKIGYTCSSKIDKYPDVQYSIDGGETWHKLDRDKYITLENIGDKVYFRGDNPNGLSIGDPINQDVIFFFLMEGKIAASGSIMSLIDGVGETTVIPCNHCFEFLFIGCDALTQAPELTATVLTESCYYRMFEGCSSLTKAPELPAKDLARYCYILMFDECTSLTQAPELPATKLADGCYMGMFEGCTSLTQAPELPATKLAESCYNFMFGGCASLIKIPELPATELATECYNSMFEGCSSITKAPELPATEFADNCYANMFYGCTNLNYIKVGVMSLDNEIEATTNWVNGIDGPGVFIFPCGSKYDKHGISEVPDNFKIISSPIVIFQNPDSTELYRDTISCDTAPVYYGVYPPVYKDGYVFVGWDVEPHVHETPDVYYYTAVYDEDTASTQNNWLCFTAEEAGSEVWYYNVDNNPDVQYSLDGGKTWKTLEEGSKVTLKEIGDKVYFKGNNPEGFSHGPVERSGFKMSGLIKASGSVMSLVDGVGKSKVIPNDYCFSALFNRCEGLTQAPELPATTLTKACYEFMFQDCINLTEAPKLPATKIYDKSYVGMFMGCRNLKEAPALPATEMKYRCYDSMFRDCVSLETPPALPAKELAQECYHQMFQDCYSLNVAPELPATKMANDCYSLMLNGCIKLTTAPKLPATELAPACYYSMFGGCIGLTEAPELPATTLDSACYSGMFYLCSALTEAPELPATTLAEGCYSWMFDDCSSLIKAPALPATELAKECYMGMFLDCTSLEKVPELPATKLAKGCYMGMFMSCTSLEKAPELPATEFADSCYIYMFKECTNLNYIKVGVMTLDNEVDATKDWVEGVDGQGTFIFPCGATYDKHGYSEVPPLFEIIGHGHINDSIIIACDSIVFDGITYYESKEWNDTISTIDECDSIIAYHLIVNKSIVKEETIYADQSFIWHDMIYTEDASWDDSLTSVSGCDSVIRYNLIINKSKLNLDVRDDDMILILPGDEQPISYILTGGKGSQYEIRDKNKLVCSGEVANDSSVNLICPNNMEPGLHTVTMEMCDEEGNCAKDEFEINVMLPDDKQKSYYVRVWNDVVICRNGDGQFLSYQWYKDGKKVEDASLQYFNDISVLDGEYMVFVSDKDGKSYFIEPIHYEAIDAAYSITATPGIVDRGKEFTLTITGVEANDLQNARIVVYRVDGTIEKILNNVEAQQSTMQLRSGDYVIVLTVNDGKNANCKVLVK